jgi:hypothetical protein
MQLRKITQFNLQLFNRVDGRLQGRCYRVAERENIVVCEENESIFFLIAATCNNLSFHLPFDEHTSSRGGQLQRLFFDATSLFDK